MTGWTFLCAALTFCALPVLDGCPARAETVTCSYPTATDGDTIRCQDGTRIRIDGVDSPEMAQQGGPEARTALSIILAYPWGISDIAPVDGLKTPANGILIVCTRTMRDSHGRTVARCSSPAIPDIGQQMVRSGHAWDWPAYSRGRYADEQEQARAERLGLWAHERPIEPWNWRRGQR